MNEPEPIVKNASDPRQVRAAVKKVRLADKDRDEQLRNVLGTRQGRKWYYEKLNEFGVYQPTFDPDPYQHAFNQGFRNAGLMLLKELRNLGPEVEFQLRKEYEEDNERGSNG